MIKNLIKDLLPLRYHRKVGRAISFFLIIDFLLRDIKGYYRSYFRNSPYKLEGIIIKEYHRLEKSLSNPSFTANRGISAAYNLLKSLETAKNLNYKFNQQYVVGVKVLNEFISYQDKNELWVSEIESRLALFNMYISSNDLECGIHDFKISDDVSSLPFSELSKNRRSVRFFSEKVVDLGEIQQALSIASMTPSVCNRQGWFTFIVQNKEAIECFRSIHNGFADKKLQPLSTLLVITFRRDIFSYPSERFQGYTDGGLYSMSLMYSLTSLGIGSCPLNANLPYKKERIFREKCNITDEYAIVMFIACGYQSSSIKIPVSSRNAASASSILIK